MRFKFDNPYWSDSMKMSFLQRRIIVASIIYYEFNRNVISDRDFDELSMQLVELMESATEEQKEYSTYWYCMYDFDGSTGFHLYGRLKQKDKEYLRWIAERVRNE